MRRFAFLLAALLALGIAPAHAGQGVNLRWSNCLGDGGTFNRNFACDTNAGSHVLVGSFELGQDMLQVSGQECFIEFAVASADGVRRHERHRQLLHHLAGGRTLPSAQCALSIPVADEAGDLGRREVALSVSEMLTIS